MLLARSTQRVLARACHDVLTSSARSTLGRSSLLLLLIASFAADARAQSPTDPVTPGVHRAYSTIYSIGVEWDVTNDTDHDAAATVQYRVNGTTTWRQALPLVRIDYNGVNRLAGSILFLSPDTEYEVRVALSDPDGGAETRTFVSRTRRVPAAPSGRVFHVAPGTGGGDGSVGNPFRGIAAAQAAATAGDTFLLHAGTYNGPARTDGTFAPVRFTAAGSSTSYIAWKAAGDGEVLVGSGIEVNASHLWLEGLTVRGRAFALVSISSPTNVVVTRCSFLENQHAIFLSGAGSNWYIADNTIVGVWPPESGEFDGEGIELHETSGHTVAHNTIRNVADGISFPHTNVDIFGNDIYDTSDDGIEADRGRANVRIWGNRIHNAFHNAISFQPQTSGPWYIIRNQIVNSTEAAFKFREPNGVPTTDRFVLLHNTIVHWGNAWPGNAMMCCQEWHLMYAIARNNLWVSVQGGEIWDFEGHERDWRADLDYDGFDWGGGAMPFRYAGVPHADLASFAAASDLETHGLRISHATCFEDFRVPGPSPTPVPPHLMTLRADCAAVDAGATLPNVNDGFAGAAPDLGAHERGAAAATYGPRPRSGAVPAAPTFLRADPSGTRVDLQWTDNASNEAGFRIERSTDGTTFSLLASVGVDVVAYNDTTVSPGNTYHYRVAAYNDAGLSPYSNTASAVVTTNSPPAVSITTPVEGASFTAPANIAIAADASDSDGSVTQVEFLRNGTLIQTDTTTPFAITWADVPAGEYALTARATDNSGATTTSAAVNVTVGTPAGVREIVLYARRASVGGGWSVTTDSTAASGARLQNPNLNGALISPPLASPTQYFEMTFTADAGVGYRLWIRGKAVSNHWANDSVYVQFDRSVTQAGAPTFRIGTTSATTYQLEDCSGCTISGWGWNDNGYGTGVLGPLIYFAQGGQQRLRVQVRQDGLGIDQIVLSAERYVTTRPGAATNDTTILPESTGGSGNVSPTVRVTAPANGATFTAPADITITADASDSDGTVARVDFLSGGSVIGSDTSAPWSFVWNDVAAGSYTITARATDNLGATATSTAVSVTVGSGPPTGAREIVLHARFATLGGGWNVTTDSTAASGARLQNPNLNAARVTTPLASPTRYFEMTFNADAGVAYRLWIRGRATSNHWANDSVYVQFDRSVTQAGAAVYRIGTTSGTTYQVEDCSGCGLSGWGWQDNGYGTNAFGPLIYFASTGQQRIRIQVREDGVGIDQIVLSADRYIDSRPGATKDDTTILPQTSGGGTPPPPGSRELVLHARNATRSGDWTVTTDSTAAGGARLQNVNRNAARVTAPLASPAHYFEMTFSAESGVGYRLWIRGRATSNHWANDSVYVQFGGSVDQAGAPVYRIGTTSGTTYQVEDCSGCGLSAWGWQDNGYGTNVMGPLIYFASTGPQRLRIQVREDGAGIDQIVLSASRYLTTRPGLTKDDTTILPATP
jgi:hypothetical protein